MLDTAVFNAQTGERYRTRRSIPMPPILTESSARSRFDIPIRRFGRRSHTDPALGGAQDVGDHVQDDTAAASLLRMLNSSMSGVAGWSDVEREGVRRLVQLRRHWDGDDEYEQHEGSVSCAEAE